MDRPLLKWIGGKTKIINQVIGSFPRKMKDYHEPFLGGGSVLLGLLRSSIVVDGTVRASDANPHLIEFFKSVRDDPCRLYASLCELVNDPKHATPESYYYYLRTRFNQTPTPALFLFLNRTCYRGLYRESKRGFNSPYGHYKKPLFPSEEQLLHVSRLIQGVQFTHQGFEESLKHVKEGDFVYLDPPYVPISKTSSFVDYVADGFVDHDALFSMCKNLPAFVLSNSDADVVLDSFPADSYEIKKIPCTRALNPGQKGKQVNEVIITRK